MERTFLSEGDFSSVSFYLVAGFTAFCCLFALWAVRPSTSSILRKVSSKKSEGGGGGGARSSSKKKACGCTCSCGGGGGVPNSSPASAPYANGSAGEMHERAPVVAERQTGASMMEQLVPEITTHALSYLDYPSLCRLSMTNSLMRKAANDDSAWKALYHKDFTMEQDSVTPINGWKAYYAATRAVVNVNAEFYNIIREKSLQAMSRLWLHADYVKCIHGSGELFTGGCKTCGRAELEKGCNGEGRIQGGIATVPGFGWWPIKAYRPCPGFVASGGRYRRQGQSMDEVAFGRGEREASMSSIDDVPSSEKKQGPRRFKR